MNEQNEHLIRYMNFEELYSIVIKGKIRFKKPYEWPDKYEALLKDVFTKEERYSQFSSKMKEDYGLQEAAKIIARLYHLYHTQYVCCFTELDNEDNDFMWRSFAAGQEIVRVEFDFEVNNDESIECDGKKFCQFIRPMDYKKEIKSIYEYVDLLDLSDETPYGKLITHKRPYFKEEKEVRLILAAPLNEDIKNLQNSPILYESLNELQEALKYSGYKEYIQCPIDHETIVNVKSNPFCGEGFEWCVEKLCTENDIKYIGKSKIYDF